MKSSGLFRLVMLLLLLSSPFLFFQGCVKESDSTKTPPDSTQNSLSSPDPVPQFEGMLLDTTHHYDEIFAKHGVSGTLVIARQETPRHSGEYILHVHNIDRSWNPYIPASTFKIFNSLVILEEKAVKGIHDTLKWDGTKRFYDQWNRDIDMADAIKYSCVWFYQEGARRVGEERMAYWLEEAKYGNREMGAAVDSFWLNGTLAINAEEQIEFLWRLNHQLLPFSPSVQQTVKEIMIVDEDKSGRKMHAKTGWGLRNGSDIGWFVGWVDGPGGETYFAINIDMPDDSYAKHRKDIVYEALRKEGVWE